MSNLNKIPSPCIHVCTNDLNNICLGCYRNIEEIREWYKFSDKEKLKVIKNAEQRKAKMENDDKYAHYI